MPFESKRPSRMHGTPSYRKPPQDRSSPENATLQSEFRDISGSRKTQLVFASQFMRLSQFPRWKNLNGFILCLTGGHRYPSLQGAARLGDFESQ